MSTNSWMDKQSVAHVYNVYNGILFSHNKNVLSSYAEKQMELEDIMLREINRNQKDKYDWLALRSEIKSLPSSSLRITRHWEGYKDCLEWGDWIYSDYDECNTNLYL